MVTVEDLVYSIADGLEDIAPNNFHRNSSPNLDLPQIVVRTRETDFVYADDVLLYSTGLLTIDLFATGIDYEEKKASIRELCMNNGFDMVDYDDVADTELANHARIIVSKQIFQ